VVSQLVALGVDSVEHGSSLTDADLLALSRRGGAWTPTLSALLFKPPADADGRLRLGALRERLAALLAQAHALGVTILAGSDVVGSVAAEVALLVDHGMSVDAAMAAASTSAQAYLGVDTTTDLVTYERDPREDLSALHSPAAVVIGGQRVR
jgi:imidazolonepropionase-like amidohydrolase